MKEQVKGIVWDFKDLGWTVQKIEQTLNFANGTLGKVINGKAGISDFKFNKLLELHQKKIQKPPTVTEGLKEQIKENNLPENKKAIEEERNKTEEELQDDRRIEEISQTLLLSSKYLPHSKRTQLEKELVAILNKPTK